MHIGRSIGILMSIFAVGDICNDSQCCCQHRVIQPANGSPFNDVELRSSWGSRIVSMRKHMRSAVATSFAISSGAAGESM